MLFLKILQHSMIESTLRSMKHGDLSLIQGDFHLFGRFVRFAPVITSRQFAFAFAMKQQFILHEQVFSLHWAEPRRDL